MKKLVILVFLLCVGFTANSQEKTITLDKETNLIEATYYHSNGVISQTGFYTKDGLLHGKWLQYDTTGKKIAAANYKHGQKVGKWFYWNANTLKEVDYSNNTIANVVEWTNKNPVAVRE